MSDDQHVAIPAADPYFQHRFEMTDVMLRDYFAAHAMQTCLDKIGQVTDVDPPQHAAKVAEISYMFADAMMERRKP